MLLANERLEQLHTELCTALSERQSELARTRSSGGDAARKLDKAEAEIRSWEADAGKIGETCEDQKAMTDLIERANQISHSLCEGF